MDKETTQNRQKSQRRRVIEVEEENETGEEKTEDEEPEKERRLEAFANRQEANSLLKNFLLNNSNATAASVELRTELARITGLSLNQVTQKLYQMKNTKWYLNRRKGF